MAGELTRTKSIDSLLSEAGATGEATLSGIIVETDPATGLAVRVEPLRIGGTLAQAIPAL